MSSRIEVGPTIDGRDPHDTSARLSPVEHTTATQFGQCLVAERIDTRAHGQGTVRPARADI